VRTGIRVVVALVAVFFVALGVWALLSPLTFYEQLATYPPYNKHLFHDVGAFQVGIGATLLFALFRRDALQVALLGTSVGTVLHAISHIVDRDLGGESTDPFLLSALALVVLLTTAAYMSQRQR
jgi:hypothetical protein